MDDLISRQAVIEALKGLPTWWADEGGYYGGAQPPMVALLDPEDAVSAIENLPSAQPEPHWTPCSEELPKENGHYLVTFHQTATEEDLGFDMDDTDVCKMRYDTKHGWRTPRRIPSWINNAVVSTVLAWMPLPEPYKGGEQDDEG